VESSGGRASPPAKQGRREAERMAKVEVSESTKMNGASLLPESGGGQSLAKGRYSRTPLSEQHLTDFENPMSNSMPSVEKIP